MKTFILFLVLAVLFAGTSCVTQRKCLEKFPVKSDTVKIVTVRDSIVFKDKIVEIKIPGKTVIDSVVIPCPPPPPFYIPDTARAETEFAIAQAWFEYPHIALFLKQKESVLQVKLDSAITEKYYWRFEYEKIVKTIETKYVPKIYKDALTICIVIFAIAFFYFGWRAFKFFKK